MSVIKSATEYATNYLWNKKFNNKIYVGKSTTIKIRKKHTKLHLLEDKQ